MKTRELLVGLMLMAVLMLTCAWQAGVTAKTEIGDLRIGVVDLRKVVDVYPTKVALEKELQAQRENAAAELKEMAKEADALAKELEMLEQKSDVARQKRLMIAEKRAKISVRKASAEYEFVERYKGALQLVFTEVLNDIEDFRKAAGFDLIVNVDHEPMQGESLDLMQRQLARKVVLASNRTLDLTDKAIEYIQAKTHE